MQNDIYNLLAATGLTFTLLFHPQIADTPTGQSVTSLDRLVQSSEELKGKAEGIAIPEPYPKPTQPRQKAKAVRRVVKVEKVVPKVQKVAVVGNGISFEVEAKRYGEYIVIDIDSLVAIRQDIALGASAADTVEAVEPIAIDTIPAKKKPNLIKRIINLFKRTR